MPQRCLKLPFVVASAAIVWGCSTLSVDPVINQEYSATPAADPGRSVVISKPLTWANGPDHLATKAVFLPVGTYTFESENADFSYFRAPGPITMGRFKNATALDHQDFEGGIAFAKSPLASIPAEVYVTVSGTEKLHVMRMGYDFYRLKGDTWEKFD